MKSFVKVNSRGAITIPIAMRRELGVRTSDRFQIESKTDGTFSLLPEDAACIFCGKKESKRIFFRSILRETILPLRLCVSCKEWIYHLLSPKGGAKSVRQAKSCGKLTAPR